MTHGGHLVSCFHRTRLPALHSLLGAHETSMLLVLQTGVGSLDDGDAAEGTVGALDGLAAPRSPASARASSISRARAAALRRDNDLMVVTAEARRQAPVGAGAGAAGSGTDALRKKLFYLGRWRRGVAARYGEDERCVAMWCFSDEMRSVPLLLPLRALGEGMLY